VSAQPGLLTSREGSRVAAANVAWLIGERAIRLVLSVFVGLAVARYLGPSDFGRLSYALALVAIGSAIAECGVGNVAKRMLLSDPADTAQTLGAAWTLRLIAGGVAYFAALGWSLGAEQDSAIRVLLLVLGLLLFQPALAISELWLQAHLQARTATVANTCALILGAAARLSLIGGGAPLWAFAVVAVIEAAIAALLVRIAAGKRGLRSLVPRGSTRVAPLWQQSWPLLLSGLTVMLYIRLDLIMVRWMRGEEEAGLYAAAVRISELWFFVPAAIASSWLPSLLRARSDSSAHYARSLQRLFDLTAGVCYLLAIPTVVLAPVIIRLAYGPEFTGGVAVLTVHAWTLVWAGLGVVRGQFCVNEGLSRLHFVSTAAGATLNVGLNLLLIPRFGGVGAAWATFAAQATAAWISSFCFADLRNSAVMQTRALLIPVRFLPYVRSAS
jgi:O-antigen/teichoic acid export membrane protein